MSRVSRFIKPDLLGAPRRGRRLASVVGAPCRCGIDARPLDAVRVRPGGTVTLTAPAVNRFQPPDRPAAWWSGMVHPVFSTGKMPGVDLGFLRADHATEQLAQLVVEFGTGRRAQLAHQHPDEPQRRRGVQVLGDAANWRRLPAETGSGRWSPRCPRTRPASTSMPTRSAPRRPASLWTSTTTGQVDRKRSLRAAVQAQMGRRPSPAWPADRRSLQPGQRLAFQGTTAQRCASQRSRPGAGQGSQLRSAGATPGEAR